MEDNPVVPPEEPIFVGQAGGNRNNTQRNGTGHTSNTTRTNFWNAVGIKWGKHVTEFSVRLPGFFLLELWLRSRNGEPMIGGGTVLTQEVVSEKFSSFFEVDQVLDYLHSRNLDQSAAHVLSYATLFLCLIILLLPVPKLIAVYLHATSFSLIAMGHYMSMRYVQLEQELGGDIILDEFTKLERHGFHFLAQVMLALCVSCLMGVESSTLRASLAIYTFPIVVRLCGLPPDKLHVAQNFSCSYAMLLISFYLLNLAPSILLWMRRAYRQVRACLVVHGLFSGSIVLWKRLRIPLQLCFFWSVLFLVQFYNSANESDGIIIQFLKSLAESTATPLSLIALATSVSYGARLILYTAKCCLFGVGQGSGSHADPQAILHAGYTEGLTLLLLCLQTGLLSLNPTQRAFLLGLVLFIVLSALFQSLFDVLEPHLLSLGASGQTNMKTHGGALALASALFLGPILMVWGITLLLPVDLWLMIITTNCLLTSLQTLSATVVFLLFWIEARAPHPWERLDDMIYFCRSAIRVLEFILAVLVISYGFYESVFGRWSWLSVSVLCVHCYYNVYLRLQSGWESFKLRREAAGKMELLAVAKREQLQELSDVCAICVTEMNEARVTPCGHFFHGGCLKKWLFVRQSCPMCHSDLSLKLNRGPRPRRHRDPAGHYAVGHTSDSEEGYSSNEESSYSTEEVELPPYPDTETEEEIVD